MSNTDRFETAAHALAAALDDQDLASELATAFSCVDADAIAEFLTAAGREGAAKGWIAAHSVGDEETDAHYVSDEIPVDPMELLNCDSCQ